jgi:hypothetical protein
MSHAIVPVMLVALLTLGVAARSVAQGPAPQNGGGPDAAGSASEQSGLLGEPRAFTTMINWFDREVNGLVTEHGDARALRALQLIQLHDSGLKSLGETLDVLIDIPGGPKRAAKLIR